MFGSTAPPSAARGAALFAGFDDEGNPTSDGIHMAPLTAELRSLTPLVEIGEQVPGETQDVVSSSTSCARECYLTAA